MKRASFALLLLTLGLSLESFAAPIFVCENPATGARIQFQQMSQNSEGLYFEMNQPLIKSIREQGVSTIGRGVGAKYGDRSFAFREYNDELRLFEKDGGFLLRIEKENRPFSLRTAYFYFNPGECR